VLNRHALRTTSACAVVDNKLNPNAIIKIRGISALLSFFWN
jgi:hypothetical protein